MVTRLYVDNFRCLINFELRLDETNVLLGPNGSGKTSVLDVLRRIQALVARGARIEETFPTRDLSLTRDRDDQRFSSICRSTVAPTTTSWASSTIVVADECGSASRLWITTATPSLRFEAAPPSCTTTTMQRGPSTLSTGPARAWDLSTRDPTTRS